jgi:multidrug efflux system membrane fusion protein
VRAKARFANDKTPLFPNQFVNVQILLRTISTIVVPVTAVRTGPGGNFVYVVNEAGESGGRTVSMRMIKRGATTVEWAEITEGVKEGELVVTEGGDRLKDGAAVRLQGEQPAARPAANGQPAQPGQRGQGQGRRQRPAQ